MDTTDVAVKAGIFANILGPIFKLLCFIHSRHGGNKVFVVAGGVNKRSSEILDLETLT